MSLREAAPFPYRVLLTSDTVGGVWTYTMSLASGLVAGRCECLVATLGPKPTAAQRDVAQAAGVTLIETDLPLEWTACDVDCLAVAADTLIQLAASQRVDLVHLHAPALAPYRWSVPTIAVAHSCVGTWWDAVGAEPMPRDLQWRADETQRGLIAAACVIAPSYSFAKALCDVYGREFVPAVIYNGYDPPIAEPCLRSETIFCAGRLWDDGKNMATLEAAAALLRYPIQTAGPRSFPGAHAFECHNMQWLGVLDDAAMREQLQRAAMFAAPSIYEPFGLAVLEAASVGTPLVLSDIPTFRELWDGAAVFVPAQDPRAWADALVALMADRTRRAKLGARARARAAGFTRCAMADRTRAIHHRVLTAALQAA
jgi:glycosyltransferase involved in cell wall biosynthesis